LQSPSRTASYRVWASHLFNRAHPKPQREGLEKELGEEELIDAVRQHHQTDSGRDDPKLFCACRNGMVQVRLVGVEQQHSYEWECFPITQKGRLRMGANGEGPKGFLAFQREKKREDNC